MCKVWRVDWADLLSCTYLTLAPPQHFWVVSTAIRQQHHVSKAISTAEQSINSKAQVFNKLSGFFFPTFYS